MPAFELAPMSDEMLAHVCGQIIALLETGERETLAYFLRFTPPDCVMILQRLDDVSRRMMLAIINTLTKGYHEEIWDIDIAWRNRCRDLKLKETAKPREHRKRAEHPGASDRDPRPQLTLYVGKCTLDHPPAMKAIAS